jgi:predicted RNA-binding Zn-ribbon protein involved in translation (DUF1610 family)
VAVAYTGDDSFSVRCADMDQIKISCHTCGSEPFKTIAEIKAFDDTLVCPNCGTAITDEDIRKQAGDAAADAIRDALSNAGLRD